MAVQQQLAKHPLIFSIFFVLSGSAAFAQTTLSLDSGSASPGGTVSLNLSLSGTTGPAGLQWTLSYSSTDVASLTVAAGSAMTAASKSLTCNGVTGSTTCLAVGMNSTTMGNGVVAVVTVTLAATSSPSVPIAIGSMYGVLADGTAATVSGTGGALSVASSNTVPAISSLSPSSATAGGANFALTVNGSGFVSGSVVNWNGSARTTTLVSGTQLQAAISASDIATTGTAQVTVSSPAPGGGTSGNSAFTISNPAPSITSLSPSSVLVGGAAFTLTVNGTGFVSNSVVNWGGSGRTTTFVSAAQLTAAISAADIAAAGTVQVTVTNPAPGGGASGSSVFTISNPAPSVTSLSPSGVTAGAAAFILAVNGSGFVSGSVVNWNGSTRATTFVSATQLTASISATDIATGGVVQVTVTNPAPGGGTSGNSAFTVNNPSPLSTSLSPTGATAGGAAFTLTVNGTGFVSSSVVNWNGSVRTTKFVSATQLAASISASDIATAGTVQVTASNPAPGGGISSNWAFAISNPVPSITSLSPSTVTAGGVAFTLTINGSGFANSSVVNWNGSPRITTFISATQVSAAISATDIGAAGTAQVTVVEPAPGGGTSNNYTITINNPAPSVTSLSPSTASAGGAAFTLTVNGSGFTGASVVNWNGSARTTTLISSTQLQAAISSSDIATAGTVQAAVFSPTPGGGTSASLSFSIVTSTSGLGAAYGFDEGTGSTTADSSGNGNTGQIHGAAWTTSGKYGNALSFNGSGYVDIGNPSSLQSTGSMTWSAWVYVSANPSGDSQILARSTGTAGWELKTTASAGGRTFAVAIASNGNGQTQRHSKTIVSLNTWYYVAGVYNANSKGLDIYVNGVLDDGPLSGKGVSKSQSLVSVNTTIGKNAAGEYFSGVLDDVRIYTKALSQTQIQTDMNTPAGGALTPLMLTSTATPAMATRIGSRASTSSPLSAALSSTKRTGGGFALSCSPRSVNAGAETTCELRMTAGPTPLQFQVSSNSDQVKIPFLVGSRPNQSTLRFQASIDPSAKQQSALITVTGGDSTAEDTILVTPAGRPVLRSPGNKIVRFGDRLTFDVTAVDPADLPLQLVASGLPVRASFDAALGQFEWTPGASQAGTYKITFTAINSARQSSRADVTIEVDSGTPVLTSPSRPACSPGSAASLPGKFLTSPGAVHSDPSGTSTDLGGTRLRLNGQYAPLLFSSETLVRFVCPDLEPGAPITLAIETGDAVSNNLTGIMQSATPQILPLETPGNQGLISFVETADIAMERNFRVPAHPAQPGDKVLVWATGLGTAPRVTVKLGEIYALVDSVQPVPGFAGLYMIRVHIPDTVSTGSAVPIQLEVTTPDGHWFGSNQATLAIEPIGQ